MQQMMSAKESRKTAKPDHGHVAQTNHLKASTTQQECQSQPSRGGPRRLKQTLPDIALLLGAHEMQRTHRESSTNRKCKEEVHTVRRTRKTDKTHTRQDRRNAYTPDWTNCHHIQPSLSTSNKGVHSGDNAHRKACCYGVAIRNIGQNYDGRSNSRNPMLLI